MPLDPLLGVSSDEDSGEGDGQSDSDEPADDASRVAAHEAIGPRKRKAPKSLAPERENGRVTVDIEVLTLHGFRGAPSLIESDSYRSSNKRHKDAATAGGSNSSPAGSEPELGHENRVADCASEAPDVEQPAVTQDLPARPRVKAPREVEEWSFFTKDRVESWGERRGKQLREEAAMSFENAPAPTRGLDLARLTGVLKAEKEGKTT